MQDGGRAAGKGYNPDGTRAKGYIDAGEAPAEYLWFDATEREKTLNQLRQGPDHDWLENHHTECRKIAPTAKHIAKLPEVPKRQDKMDRRDESGIFGPIDSCTFHLQSLARNKVLQAEEAGKPITVVEAVAELVDTGSPKLSEEAA